MNKEQCGYIFRFIGVSVLVMCFTLIKGQNQKLTNLDIDDNRIKGEVYYQNHFRIQGTPFLFNTWLKGDILTFQGEWKKDVMLKYDAYEDQVLYYNEKLSVPVVIDNDYIKAFLIYTDGKSAAYTFRFMDHEALNNGNARQNFLQVIEEGEIISLYAEYRTVYVKYINPENRDRYYGKFVHKKGYLLKRQGHFIPVKLRIKSFIKYLPENKKEIRAFVRTHKLNLESHGDVLKLIRYLNSIA